MRIQCLKCGEAIAYTGEPDPYKYCKCGNLGLDTERIETIAAFINEHPAIAALEFVKVIPE